jgi:transposase
VSNVLNEQQKQQVIALGRLGWSLRRIERESGVRRETISAYLKEAGVARRPPRGRRIRAKPASQAGQVTTDSTPAKPASDATEVTPDSGGESGGRADAKPEPGRSPSASACEPYGETIEVGLSQGRNAKAIWQDLVDTGFPGAYQSVKRFIRKVRGKQSPEACAVIETAPGEELQVDYGSGPMVRDAHSGKYRRTRLFVLTLGYSRKSVRLMVFGSSSQTWAELHEKAFRRLGGVTRVVVLDNLREGVLKPDIYDPTINPLYRDMLRHYNVVALPCRVRDPDRKGLNSYCTS